MSLSISESDVGTHGMLEKVMVGPETQKSSQL